MSLREQGAALVTELYDLIDVIRTPGPRQSLMVQEMRRAVLSLELLEMDYMSQNPPPSVGFASALINTITMTRITGWRAAAAYIKTKDANDYL